MWQWTAGTCVCSSGVRASAWRSPYTELRPRVCRGRRSRAICRPTGRWPRLTCEDAGTAGTCPARTAWIGTPGTWWRCCAISAGGRYSPGIRWGRMSRCWPAIRTPELVRRLVLVDGGLPLPVPDGADLDALLDATLGPAIARLGQTFPSTEAYLDFWRAHPALAGHWTPDVEAYVRYDLTGEPGQLRARAIEDAVRADGRDVLAEKPFADALAAADQADAAADRAGRDVRRAAAADRAGGRRRLDRTRASAAAAGSAGDEPLHDHVREGGRGGRVPGDQVGRALTVDVTRTQDPEDLGGRAPNRLVRPARRRGGGRRRARPERRRAVHRVGYPGLPRPDRPGPARTRPRATPMTYQAFTGSAAARRRYWARSHLGWRHIARASAERRPPRRRRAEPPRPAGRDHHPERGRPAPGRGHRAPGRQAPWAESRSPSCTAACTGSSACRAGSGPARADLDRRLAAANPGWGAELSVAVNPDGDAVLDDEAAARFRVARLLGVRRRAQAGRGVLRRERAPAADAGLLRPRRGGLRAGRPGLVAHRDVRVPVRPARGRAGAPGRHREPGRHPGRRLRRRDPRRPARPDPHGAGGGPVRAGLSRLDRLHVGTGGSATRARPIAGELLRRPPGRTLPGQAGRAAAPIEVRPLDFADRRGSPSRCAAPARCTTPTGCGSPAARWTTRRR